MTQLGDILIIENTETGAQQEVIITQVFGDGWYQVTATATGKTSLIMMLGTEHVVTDPDAIEAAKATTRAARKAFDTETDVANFYNHVSSQERKGDDTIIAGRTALDAAIQTPEAAEDMATFVRYAEQIGSLDPRDTAKDALYERLQQRMRNWREGLTS